MKQIYVSSFHLQWRKISCRLATAALLMTALPSWAQDTFALNTPVTVKARNQSVANVLSDIEKQTHLSFVYDGSQVDRSQPLNINANRTPLKEVLRNIFKKDAHYTVVGNQVIVKQVNNKPAPAAETTAQAEQVKEIVVSGKVTLRDAKENLQQVPGITIRVKGANKGTHTDADGNYRLTVNEDDILLFTFVGYKPVEVPVKGRNTINITLDEDAAKIKEVVITGIYERAKESFSGSVSTYTAKELKQVGNQNVIQSLRSLDPAFTVFENNLAGSNPNMLPNLEIRGKTSVLGLKEQYGTDPNQPLFILDGFETSLRTIIDLDMNRVESVTILKDAASTAIYGSKAANGVIVIETKKPKPGELKVSYTTDNSVTVPDLRDYNLMDATEKLAFEKAVGRYTLTKGWGNPGDNSQQLLDSLYNKRLMEVKRGVNTYWLSEPLRTGFTTGHSLYVDGGDNQMRYSAGVNYKKISGVMKGSGRDMGGANLKLMYRRNKLSFSNNLSVSFYTADESPYGSFAEFAKANPYYRKRNEDGSIPKYLDISPSPSTGTDTTANPLYNAMQNTTDRTKGLGLINNFITEYQVNKDLRIRGRLGITREQTKQAIFISPRNTVFDAKDPALKGLYHNTERRDFNYDGELTTTYGRIIGNKHQINAVAGWNFSQKQGSLEGYEAVGFPDKITTPAFASGYNPNGMPLSWESTTRSTSFYVNGGYVYDRRFVLEANYRLDGSSVFGSKHYFTNSWSVGGSWNVHNEDFLQHTTQVNMLKLRASIGTPGNQNFGAYQSFSTYGYYAYLNNNFGLGAVLLKFGNKDLLWQKTLDKNIGADIVLFNNKFRLNADVYQRTTDPLVAIFNVPTSTGTTDYSTNLGLQKSTGYNFQAMFFPIYRPQERFTWSVSISAKHEKAEYAGIGSGLAGVNKENQSKSLTRYYDGGSPTAIWGVRSGGIDPGTGNEVFIKKDGSLTFSYDANDEVVLGDERPKLDGIIGTNVSLKGITVGVYLRYRTGGDVFNEALYNKVENIDANNLRYNQDKRAYYGRWMQPGDEAQYRKIWLYTDKNAIAAITSKMTSRFVQRENTLAGESINLGYDFPNRIIKNWRMSSLRVNAYMNDIFRISSITRERGIEYPFANSASFSISVGF